METPHTTGIALLRSKAIDRYEIAVELETYEQMTAYKHPRIFIIQDALPMTAIGKMLKRFEGLEQFIT